ncbi:MAG: energy transducer TonB [Pseudomonadota bacterium]
MKRLLFAAVLALGLHGLMFSLDARWLKEGPDYKPLQKPIALQLLYPPPPKTPDLPEKKPQEMDKPTVPNPSPPERLKKVSQTRRKPFSKKKVSRDLSLPKKEDPAPPEPASLPEPSPSPGTPSPLPPVRQEGPPHEASLSGKGDQGIPLPGSNIQTLREAIPAYSVNPKPEYPGLARRRGYQGTVILDVFVNRRGKVTDLRVAQSSGHALLDHAAKSSVKGWLFEPAKRGEEPIDMWVKIPVRFQLR